MRLPLVNRGLAAAAAPGWTRWVRAALRRLTSAVTLPGLTLLFLFLFVAGAAADELDDALKLFRAGKYEACLTAAAKADSDDRAEDWQLLEARTLLTLGRYPEAESVISNALTQMGGSIRLRLLGFDTANAVSQPALARTRLRAINQLAAARTWAYRDPPNFVALGRAALLLGADPKTVLERLFDLAQKTDPELRDAYLAAGELALDKHDYAIAARKFSDALKKFPDDPDVLQGLARAYEPSARGRMLELTQTALAANPNHVPSLLLLADHLIDAEEYNEAGQMLERALQVNPWQPEAWSYRAVLAHLRNDAPGETEARARALKFWTNNPAVDHLIGLKLSQKYRFAEGSSYQQQALTFEPDFLPAQIQLAEDLLRLGDESAGWQLAENVRRQDAYDVTAFNLSALHGTMRKFQTLTNADFVLRMSPHEAALYGDRALALLDRARSNLTAKFGIAVASPTYVEIFPEQKDFGVRTFGMPGNPGFLGVCFGRVITANSPASQGGHPSNWEAVLWHEFCHVVTLQMTKNKMPRWLSEGISVFEELQANPAWGQSMNPQYREMILGGDLTPVSELSSAFLTPKSDLHVQFAYYQSALVVEYLLNKFGFDNLKAILRDLGEGVDINDVIPRHTAPMKQIEQEFAAFAKARAEAYGPELDWKKPGEAGARFRSLGLPDVKLPAPDPDASKNYWVLLEAARVAISEKQWAAAKPPLNRLIELCPNQSGPGNAYELLASVHRGMNETNAECASLEAWARQDADAVVAYDRLMELAAANQDWAAVAQNAERYLAVNPLLPRPYRYLARASEALGASPTAIGAYEKLLLLDPADPADVHFRLARLLRQPDAPAAKRHVLQALEEAPRYREAQRLLLELARADHSPTNPATPDRP